MNSLDKQYQALLQDILDNGTKKQTRNGDTLSVFGRQIRHRMSAGFPLITTKKMYWKGIVTELIWFLRGDTNIKFLVDNDCHIWDGDAYKNFKSRFSQMPGIQSSLPTKEEFIDKIKNQDGYAEKWGDLGPIYGKQWRSWGYNSDKWIEEYSKLQYGSKEEIEHLGKRGIDQIQNLINDLKTNPDSRRLMVSAWNVGELDQMVLPPCHYGFQVYTRELSLDEKIDLLPEKKGWDDLDTLTFKEKLEKGPQRAISLMFNMRSVDTFLGLPFNIASYGLLLEIIAKEVNMVPDELIGNLGDVHLYSNHVEQAKEQIGREITEEEILEHLQQSGMDAANYEYRMEYVSKLPKRTRQPYPLPTLKIEDEVKWKEGDCLPSYSITDFTLENYQSHPAIKAPLSN